MLNCETALSIILLMESCLGLMMLLFSSKIHLGLDSKVLKIMAAFYRMKLFFFPKILKNEFITFSLLKRIVCFGVIPGIFNFLVLRA